MIGTVQVTKRSLGIAPGRRFDLIFSSHWSFPKLQADSSCFDQKFWDANEIIGGRCKHEEPFHQVSSAVSGLAQATDRLHPPEWFFDPLSLDRADAIAGLPGLAWSSIMSSAVARSAVPLASVNRASTMSPLRFSTIRCPM